MPIRLTRERARTIAVRAAVLGDERPAGLLDMVRRLAALRIEQTAAVAPAADHISWSRLGDGYVPGLLDRAVAERKLFEYDWMLRPIEDLPAFLPKMRAPSPYPNVREWLEVNKRFRRGVLDRIDDLGALGVIRATAGGTPVEQFDMRHVGEEAEIEGLPGVWRVDPVTLASEVATTRTVVLSPLDRLVFERERLPALWGYEYALEMYKPAAKRRWGYFALPILHHDRLIGKADAAAEHAEGVLRVDAVHEDEPFTPAMRDAVEGALTDLADRLGLEVERG